MNGSDCLVLETDSYKVSHWLQFPKGSEYAYYYIESRGGTDKLKFFGLQAILKKILSYVPSGYTIDYAEKFWNTHGLPFNKEGWLQLRRLGYYPLEIKAVKEGGIYKPGQPLVTIENTDPRFFWLPGWIETRLLQLWYPTTVCSRSWKCKKVIKEFLQKTGDISGLPFKLHDFGYRGVSSQESAELGGMAHLVNFMGTDTVAGIFAAQEYYGNNDVYKFYQQNGYPKGKLEEYFKDNMYGFSIPAAEHSTMTSWGIEGEKDAYENMLDRFAKPGSIVAVVSDSYDLKNAVENIWGNELKQKVLDSGATIVIRPDSGEPKKIVVRTLKQLDRLFGSDINDKGYKVLNPAVRVIQGDGIGSDNDIREILEAVANNGFSADNLAFGMGGGLLQQVNRDTFKFAMKCSAIRVNGEWRDVCKKPADAPWKASKAGRFDNDPNLNVVWKDGKFIKEYTFNEVRENE